MIDKEIAEAVKESLEQGLLTEEQQQELQSLLKQYSDYKKYNQLEFFEPLNYQKDFFEQTANHRYCFLSAANRLGKSHAGCYLTAAHLCGKYPEDWKGRKFSKPIKAWVVSVTAKSGAESVQEKLLGTNNVKLGNEEKLGTGFIPKDCLRVDTLQRDGANAVKVSVKHYTDGVYDGDSELTFVSCSQGESAWFGASLDWVMQDEEPPHDSLNYYLQLITRLRTNRGSMIITATPEHGATELIKHFLNSEAPDVKLIKYGIPDVVPELYSQEEFENMKLELPQWQHGFRLYGDPNGASGAIFDLNLDSITCLPFEIPDTWQRCVGFDLGFDHKSAAIWSAYHIDSDTIYIYDEWGASETLPSVHASTIKKRGDWIPVILPHDAIQRQKNTGEAMIDVYRNEGLNVASDTFYNFHTSQGKKNNDVFVGLNELRARMKEGRLKIFSNCQELLKELRFYRMENNRIKKLDDDYIDAMRYSAMSVTHRGVSKDSVDHDYSLTSSFKGW